MDSLQQHAKSVLKSSFFTRGSLISLLPLLTALMLCICLTTEIGAACCFVALVPLAVVIKEAKLPRSVYASVYLSGLVVHLMGMYWLLECYRYGQLVGPYLAQWFWIGTWGGMLFVCLLAGSRYVYQRQPLPMTVFLPLLWVSYELIRHQMAEVITGTGFPWLKLGTAITDSQRLVQIADLGGEFLLSFLVAMLNGAVVDGIQIMTSKKSRISLNWTIAVAMLLLFAAQGYGLWRCEQKTGKPGPNIGLMGELDLPPMINAQRLKDGFGHKGGVGHKADMLLWPELAYHHAIVECNTMERSGSTQQSKIARAQKYLNQSARELGATIVIGCERRQATVNGIAVYNSLACSDPIDGYQGSYDKTNLVPSAEQSQHVGSEYCRGDGYREFQLPVDGDSYRFATAICYDLCFGQHFLNPSSNSVACGRPDFLVQSGAEGQDSSNVVATRMLRYAKLRAIENRRALVRNATFGYSALIDSNGEIRVVLPSEAIESPQWLGAVPIDDRYSFYAAAGDWVAYLSSIAILGLAVIGWVWPIT